MIKKIKEGILNFLEIELVFPKKVSSKILVSLFFIPIIFSFLIYYKPFNLEQFPEILIKSSFVYSAITGCIVFLLLLFAHPFFSSEDKPFNNLALLLLMVLTMPLNYFANLGYSHINETVVLLDMNYNYVILMMDLVFGPALLLANLVDWKKKKLVIIDLNLREKSEINEDDKFHGLLKIVNETNKPLLEVNPDTIIAASSNENYSEIFILKNGAVTRLLIRITFTKLFQQLSEFPEFIRCHRTYIVNLKYVTGFVNNSGNRLLRLKHFEEAIPVSKSYPIEQHFPTLTRS